MSQALVGDVASAPRPVSVRSTNSGRRANPALDERTPLLARTERQRNEDDEDGDNHSRLQSAASLLRTFTGQGEHGKQKRPWSSLIALLLLFIFMIAIMLLGFFVPQGMESYVMQAKQFSITKLSMVDFTQHGANVRVEAQAWLDADEVSKPRLRKLGLFATFFVRNVKTQPLKVEFTLQDYDGTLAGVATIPELALNIRNGHVNHLDTIIHVEPGRPQSIQRVADDWAKGRLSKLRLISKAEVKVSSGLLRLPTQSVEQSLEIGGDQLSTLPEYNISRLTIHEHVLEDGSRGMKAELGATIHNKYPIDASLPEINFGVLVGGCESDDHLISVADATLCGVRVGANRDVAVKANGIVSNLSEALMSTCPGTQQSPLDALVGRYLQGDDINVYVAGSQHPTSSTPKWISDLISNITIPVPLPSRAIGGLVRNFSLSDLEFALPNPLADPDTTDGQPQISATINVIVAIPEEMNFNLDVQKIRADADIFYKTAKLGVLHLRDWQPANSTRVEPHDGESQPLLKIEAAIKDAPVIITNGSIFSNVVKELLFGDGTLFLEVKANVDVQASTALGAITVRQVPAEGSVPVKPITGGSNLVGLKPEVGDLQIVASNSTSLTLQASVNVTNPTAYSATIPYADVHFLVNDTILGHATTRDIHVRPGRNTGVVVQAIWSPRVINGIKGERIGRELLSQYISGYNTTLTLRTHSGSIPSQPMLGEALKSLQLTIPTPRLRAPKNGDDDDDNDGSKRDDALHFVQGATMHILSSSASFNLFSPFSKTTLQITYINATALYKGESVGHIFYGKEFDGVPEEFDVPPGSSVSPRLPVDWSLGSVGYEAVRRALGGKLKLSAEATVDVSIGEYEQRVWYKGGAIGTHVRL